MVLSKLVFKPEVFVFLNVKFSESNTLTITSKLMLLSMDYEMANSRR